MGYGKYKYSTKEKNIGVSLTCGVMIYFKSFTNGQKHFLKFWKAFFGKNIVFFVFPTLSIVSLEKSDIFIRF